MDRILINDLAARCIIGVDKEERRDKQDVLINLVLYADLAKACKTDRFEDTVDYREIKKRIVVMVENSRYYVVEALAEAVSEICLSNPKVIEVKVKVEKPSALRFVRTVGVEIIRSRKS